MSDNNRRFRSHDYIYRNQKHHIVKDVSDFLTFNTHDSFEYQCIRCNKRVYIKDFRKERKEHYSDLLCNSCRQIIYRKAHPEVTEKTLNTRANWTDEQRLANHNALISSWVNRSEEEKRNIANKISSTRKNKTQEEKDKIKAKIQEQWAIKTEDEIKEIVSKRKVYKKEHYGDENFNNRKLASETYKAKTGYDHHMHDPEFCNRIKSIWANKTDEEKKELARKNLELDRAKHCGKLFTQTDEFKQIMQNYHKTVKYQETLSKLKSDENRTHMRELNLNHPEWRRNARAARYFYDNNIFDSKAEFTFYLKCKSEGLNIVKSTLHIPFTNSYGETHYYEPDFEIDGQLYEVKGEHLIPNENGETVYTKDAKDDKSLKYKENTLCKFKLMKQLGVIIVLHSDMDEYIKKYETLYGQDFYDQYKMVKCIDSHNKTCYWTKDLLIRHQPAVYPEF